MLTQQVIGEKMVKQRVKNISLSEQRKKVAFRKILRDKEESAVNGIVYIVLAFCFGAVGFHNFYAKFWKRGAVQFALTVFAPFMLFIPLLFTSMWAEAELLFVNRDKDGRLFRGSRRIIWGLRMASIILLVWGMMSIETIDFDGVFEMVNLKEIQDISKLNENL